MFWNLRPRLHAAHEAENILLASERDRHLPVLDTFGQVGGRSLELFLDVADFLVA
jgi:hypothetical protein